MTVRCRSHDCRDGAGHLAFLLVHSMWCWTFPGDGCQCTTARMMQMRGKPSTTLTSGRPLLAAILSPHCCASRPTSPCSQIYHVRTLQPGEHEDHRVKPKDTLRVILLSYVDKGLQGTGQDTLPFSLQVPVRL